MLLRHLVTNPVDNAARYNRPGGTVRVRLTERTLTITKKHGDTHGTGPATVWASIAASIAQAHAARVSVRPRQGGGPTVSVTFTGT
ncbi:hypothetical protein ACFYSF_46290 [Streptomyces canus]|uniref:hypothetical protein n=1 Tax=Streptomyces canus TaxID=58343 RepID=UPI00369C98A2